ncbi:ATP-grasp fold amidoligase family protein [Ruania alba]|uniref:Glutathione synthase/RimK-type ligase, ATP-grasp superfamily n=1 Tax=Ruania alba TaxID=648782 RepID=A0A1H5HMA1_9MICO|nr:ATP-grasp fold amidoligase family protein [Ruania alba]SEE29146.1 Glutathione synthase/RimK-type ligase, ATP-grasp superfamily [Ruania alba]
MGIDIVPQPLRRRLRRAVPPIAWRDEALAVQRERLDELRARVDERDGTIGDLRRKLRELERERVAERPPSFWSLLELLRAEATYAPAADPHRLTPLRQMPFKLRNYMLAQSHGIAHAEVLGVWSTAAEIDLADLSGRIVVKGDGGAGGQGVLLLDRAGDGGFTEIGTDRTYPADEIGPILGARHGVRPPFFAERFIQAGPGGPTVPVDVKFFSFYGEVGHALLRRVWPGAEGTTVEYRYVAADGTDLGEVMPGQRVAPDVPLPPDFAEMVQVARHLSRAVGLPFCRVDLYSGTDGPLLGEITRAPGGRRIYERHHDERLGRLWVAARARLSTDLARGRPFGALHGQYPVEALYPTRSAESPAFVPGEWPLVVADCQDWCTPQS